jgi:cyclohexanecarboxylate-CoA ligase
VSVAPVSSPLFAPATLWERIERRAGETPDRVMVRDPEDRSLTFAEYLTAAERTAAGLAALGVSPGTRVSWQLPTMLESAVLCGALARLDAVQIPIVPILRRREVAFITAQTKAELLIVPRTHRGFDFAQLAAGVAAEVGFATHVLDLGAGGGPLNLALPDGDPDILPPPPRWVPGQELPVRWIYYTSGTTADPKGAQHTDQSVVSSCGALLAIAHSSQDDVFVTTGPIAHVGGMLHLSLQFVTGCQRILIDVFDRVQTPLTVARFSPTRIVGSLAVINAYIAAQRERGDAPLLPRLKMIVNGGSPRPPELDGVVREVLGGVGVLSSWGLTEFPAATMCPPECPDEVRAISEGLPAPGVEVVVCDPDGKVLPAGAEGELRLTGPQMFSGYVDSSLNAAAFDHRGRFRTGDLGVMTPDGHVRVTGRLKDVIIRNAENISALEVENVLSSMPEIADVAVIGVPDERTGERCCAVIQLSPGVSAMTVDDLAGHCRRQGLAIQKTPEQVELVDFIPRNELGKIQKQQLRQRFGVARSVAG